MLVAMLFTFLMLFFPLVLCAGDQVLPDDAQARAFAGSHAEGASFPTQREKQVASPNPSHASSSPPLSSGLPQRTRHISGFTSKPISSSAMCSN